MQKLIGFVMLLILLLPLSLSATTDYAEETKQGCLICHL